MLRQTPETSINSAPKYKILYWFLNTFAFNIVTKNSRFVFIYPIISHCEQKLERKYLAADDNYSYTNMIFFLYARITLLKKGNSKYI